MASICKAAVVKGTGLALVPSVCSMLATEKTAGARELKRDFTSSASFRVDFSRLASKISDDSGSVTLAFWLENLPATLKVDFEANFSISRSFSTISRRAGD